MNNKYLEAYSKRISRMSLCIFLCAFIILGCFFNLQVLPHPELKNIVLNHGYIQKTIIGNRGKIIDINSKELAITIDRYKFFVNTIDLFDKDGIISIFSSTFNKSEDYYAEKLSKKSKYIVLEKNISYKQAYPILDKIKDIKGLWCEKKPNRLYKYNSLASQTIGYINENNHGMLGIEKNFDYLLKGDSLEIELRKGAKGKYFNYTNNDYNNLDGHDIQLTIDIDLQRILQEELYKAVESTNAIGANGIIVNPHNGEILALASIPEFDPNNYNQYDIKAFNNAGISNLYEPGSTFKIIPISMAIESDSYNPNDSIYCENGVYRLINGKKLHDHEEHGLLTIEDILVHSSNIGISKISDSFTNISIYKKLKKFGFGSKTYLPLGNEMDGKIRDVKRWSKTSKHYISIGQELSITNIQLAMAYSVIANNGFLVEPHIIKSIKKNDETKYSNRKKVIRKVLDIDTSKRVLNMLQKVVEQGTAESINLQNYYIAGKTGTAQKYKEGNYSAYIATFASIFPANNPEYVMIVSVDEPTYGMHWANLSAVPASREIIKRMLINNKAFHKKTTKNIVESEPIAIKDMETILSRSSKIETTKLFPSFKGKTLKESLKIANASGIILKPEGISGTVKKQSIYPGTRITPNMICVVTMGI